MVVAATLNPLTWWNRKTSFLKDLPHKAGPLKAEAKSFKEECSREKDAGQSLKSLPMAQETDFGTIYVSSDPSALTDPSRIRPFRVAKTQSHISRTWEVDLDHRPSAEVPYPPLIMEFIQKRSSGIPMQYVGELKLSDLHFWRGLPHMIHQWAKRNQGKDLICWFDPSDGSITCFMTTPALQVLFNRHAASKQQLRDDGSWTELVFDEEMIAAMDEADVQKLLEFGHYLNGEVWRDFTVPEANKTGENNHSDVIKDDEYPLRIFYDKRKVGPQTPLDHLWKSDLNPMHLGPEHRWFVTDTPFDHMLSTKQSAPQFLDDPDAISKWGHLMNKPKEPVFSAIPADMPVKERAAEQLDQLKALGFNLEPGSKYLKPPENLQSELAFPKFRSLFKSPNEEQTRSTGAQQPHPGLNAMTLATRSKVTEKLHEYHQRKHLLRIPITSTSPNQLLDVQDTLEHNRGSPGKWRRSKGREMYTMDHETSIEKLVTPNTVSSTSASSKGDTIVKQVSSLAVKVGTVVNNLVNPDIAQRQEERDKLRQKCLRERFELWDSALHSLQERYVRQHGSQPSPTIIARMINVVATLPPAPLPERPKAFFLPIPGIVSHSGRTRESDRRAWFFRQHLNNMIKQYSIQHRGKKPSDVRIATFKRLVEQTAIPATTTDIDIFEYSKFDHLKLDGKIGASAAV